MSHGTLYLGNTGMTIGKWFFLQSGPVCGLLVLTTVQNAFINIFQKLVKQDSSFRVLNSMNSFKMYTHPGIILSQQIVQVLQCFKWGKTCWTRGSGRIKEIYLCTMNTETFFKQFFFKNILCSQDYSADGYIISMSKLCTSK